MKTGRGNHMQLRRVFVQLVPQGHAGKVRGRFYKLDNSHIPEIRKLLRMDMSVEAIALQFGVTATTLRSFIRRRRICDLKARRDFHSLQESLQKEREKKGYTK